MKFCFKIGLSFLLAFWNFSMAVIHLDAFLRSPLPNAPLLALAVLEANVFIFSSAAFVITLRNDGRR